MFAAEVAEISSGTGEDGLCVCVYVYGGCIIYSVFCAVLNGFNTGAVCARPHRSSQVLVKMLLRCVKWSDITASTTDATDGDGSGTEHARMQQTFPFASSRRPR